MQPAVTCDSFVGENRSFGLEAGLTTVNSAFNGGTLVHGVTVESGRLSFAQSSNTTTYLGGSLNLSGGTIDGAGAATVLGSFNQSGGTLATAGVFTLSGASHSWSGGEWTGSGTVQVGPAVLLNVTGGGGAMGSRTLINQGTVDLQSALLEASAGTLAGDGLFRIGSGSTLRNTEGFTNAGTLAGLGTIDVGAGTLTNVGLLHPGSSAITGESPVVGTLTVVGNLRMSDGTTGGSITLPYNAIDVGFLSVTGAAELTGGTLNVEGGFITSGTYSFLTASQGVSGSLIAGSISTSGTYDLNGGTLSVNDPGGGGGLGGGGEGGIGGGGSATPARRSSHRRNRAGSPASRTRRPAARCR